jgi:hypothetical protein
MRFEKGSKRCALEVAVLAAFFILAGTTDIVPGEEAAMSTTVIVSGSNALAFWLAAHVHKGEFTNQFFLATKVSVNYAIRFSGPVASPPAASGMALDPTHLPARSFTGINASPHGPHPGPSLILGGPICLPSAPTSSQPSVSPLSTSFRDGHSPKSATGQMECSRTAISGPVIQIVPPTRRARVVILGKVPQIFA